MRRSVSASPAPHEGTRLLGRIKLEDATDFTFTGELGFLAATSIPVSLSYALQNSLQTLSVVVVGRLSPHALSVAAFSYMLAMVTGWCVALGGTTAVDTLASSSFTSTKAPKTDVGVILQRCIVALSLLFLPAAVLWWFIKPVLLLLGQDEQLAIDCQRFLRVLSAGAPGYLLFESVKKYLQCQGIMQASTLVLLVTSPLNVGLNYLLVHRTNLGLLGAAVATSITYWLSFLLLCAYARFVRGSECWGGWDRRCLQRLPEFLKLAIPGVLHVGTEWWAFEIVALAAGRLGALPLASQSIIMTADQILNTFVFGIGVAASARIGNLLGARAPAHAKLSANAAAVLSTIVGALVLAILMGFREQFGLLFSDEQDVVRLVADVLPYVAAFQIADGWAQSCGGVLRGMGKQHVGASVNLIGYYILALPMGIALAFKTSLGLAGLWIGQCAALFIVGVGQYILVAFFTDWDVEVKRSQARLESDDKVDEEEETRSRRPRDPALSPYQAC